jgi:hypothetical protein
MAETVVIYSEMFSSLESRHDIVTAVNIPGPAQPFESAHP